MLTSLLLSAASFASEAHGGVHEGGGHGGSLVHGSPWAPFIFSWIAILFLVTLGILGTRRLAKVPGPVQNMLEMVVGGLGGFFSGILGPGGDRHVPLLVTLFLYIFVMNCFGLTGILVPPTASLNMTIALAVVAIIYVQIQGIRANGFGGYLRHFVGEPVWLAPLMVPLHIIGELAKPLSLSFRLFGNIFGEETVMGQLALLGPLVIFGMKYLPIQAPLLPLGLLKCLIQAVVFTTLTAVYLVMMTDHEGHDEHHEQHGELTGTAAEARA